MKPTFYLGTHRPGWLWNPGVDGPLFVSHRALARYRTLRPATCGWALDSGGFTELSAYGEWRTSPQEYVRAVARYDREIGSLEWAAPQDWMCEPFITAGTGLSVAEHQRRTVANFLLLKDLWRAESDQECPFMPVLQGWQIDDYHRCIELYERAGEHLEDYPIVGLGSVCRRQGTAEITALVRSLTPRYALHGFGMKTRGLLAVGDRLESADSLAWSYNARRSAPLAGHLHKNCANCAIYAARWRARLLDLLAASRRCGIQADLFDLASP